MLAEMLLTHTVLIYAFIGFLLLGFLVPMVKKEPLAFKKASFIYTMVFQAIITMILFSGIVALIVGKMDFNVPIIVMIAVFAVMMGIEISKHKKIKKANLEDEATLSLMRSGFTKASVFNLIVLVAITIFMMVVAKG